MSGSPGRSAKATPAGAGGLKVSLTAADAELARAGGLIARRAAGAGLGIPADRGIAGRAAAIPGILVMPEEPG